MAIRNIRNTTPYFSRSLGVIVKGNALQPTIQLRNLSEKPNAEKDQASEFAPEKENINRSKLLVIGGNGFVGSAICKEAVEKGHNVQSLSRSGAPQWFESWMNEVDWIRGDVLEPEKWRHFLPQSSAVISCVGAFGSTESMIKINGHANAEAARVAAESGVPRFIYISAHDVGLGLSKSILKGYYEGKKIAEEAVQQKFLYGGVILRPAMIHGTRKVGSISLPLSLVGAPLELILKQFPWSKNLPLLGPALAPPVSVGDLARVVVKAATDNSFPPGIVDVWAILKEAHGI